MLESGLDTYKTNYNSLFNTDLSEFIDVMVDMYYNVFIHLELETDNHFKAKQQLSSAFINSDKSVLDPNEMLKNYINTILLGTKYKKWELPVTKLDIINVTSSEQLFNNLISWIKTTKVYKNNSDYFLLK